MSLTAAASGFVVFLLSVQVIQGQDGWGVTYTSTQICAVKGSTVEIHCRYRYPYWWKGSVTVEKTLWYTKMKNDEPVDLTTVSEYSDRVQYSYNNKDCTLRISDLRESDSAVYKFRFITNQEGGRYTGSPGVTLSVTAGLQVISYSYRLECQSSCRLPNNLSYVWYKNGQEIQAKTSYYLYPVYNSDSYSCALQGYKDFPSPSVCVQGESCNRVTYTDRSICASEGSSVDISCYNSYNYPDKSTFWFSRERNHQWQNPSQPEDLSTDSQYTGRVHVETERGRSTLRISDLRERDSAEYHFKFITPRFEWSSLPGTTLTVTALQVQVIRVYNWYSTEAELKCHSSCSPAGGLSYVWFKNREHITSVETSTYTTWFNPTDVFSCALKGHEKFPSPSVLIQSQDGWGVTYTSTPICAVKGSTVEIHCSYTYPSWWKSSVTRVERTLWFTKMNYQPVDLTTDSEYSGRVQYSSKDKDCTLRISDLRERDSAVYKFRFTTNQEGGRYISSPGVTLSVTAALQVQVIRVTVQQSSTEAELKCHSSCSPAGGLSYVWFKNREHITSVETSTYTTWFNPTDVFSCGLKGHEKFPSPSVLIQGQDGWGVTYTSTQICAVKGSTVEIHCSYRSWWKSSVSRVERTLWFTKMNYYQPVDLTTDSEYSGRVQYSSNYKDCTLRISDLRERDSAVYKFRFTTNQKSGRYISSPGVTLSVTALQVQVIRVTVQQSSTEAELKCHSSCSPAGGLSYVWFKNREHITSVETSTYTTWFNPTDVFSCALKGHEKFPSPSVLIQGQYGWGVTYTSTQICAVKGSTVEIHCSYRYPSRWKGSVTTLERTLWFTKMNYSEPVDLITDSEYSGRVQYSYKNKDCTLRISDLRERDSAVYKFRFTRNQEGGRYIGSPGVTLSVTALQVQVTRVHQTYAWLKCHSSCSPAGGLSYVWFKNREHITSVETSTYTTWFNPTDVFSCGLKGHEKFPSPSVLIQGQDGWGVTYTSTQICAVKGSTVEIHCSYTYPYLRKGSYTRVERTLWFTKKNNNEPVDLTTDSEYSGRVQYSSNDKDCTLRISDLRERDSAVYKFRFTTNQEGGRYTGSPGVTLSVTALQVQVIRVTVQQSSTEAELKCHSSCSPAGGLSYVWFKNREHITSVETSTYTTWFNPTDVFSCGLKGHEKFPSPSVLIQGQDGWGVTYTSTPICAVKGSTVEIHCSYTYPSWWKGSYTRVQRTLWFTKMNNNEPVDLTTDSEYSGHVQYSSNNKDCTLRISDLRERDSAVYKFRFITNQEGGRYIGSPGVTLSVTALQVQVIRVTVQQSSTEAELKCHSSCSPAGGLSYVWFKNREHITSVETSTYTTWFNPTDVFSCGLKGHEKFPSPSVLIQGQDGWGVTYTSTQICAVKGSTVEIHCSYTYPSWWEGSDTRVERTFWFTKLQDEDPVDLRTDSKYSGRVQYSCHEKICTLRISDLRERDSAEYEFRFITNQEGGRYTGSPGVTLSVTGLQVQIRGVKSCISETCTWAELKCHSSCLLPDRSSYIWYKNGEKINKETSSYSDYFYPPDSYSCALNAYKDSPSPSVCGHGHSCNTVTYTDRSVCAFKGSSVDISCMYSSYESITSKFWFSPERSHQWQNPSQPEDLSTDSQYSGRVQVIETWRGRSTLRISDLRERDSAEYHFKFITPRFEWRSSLPGTTLTVTDQDLQVQVIWSSTGPKLICHSSCLIDRSSFLWYKNGTMIQGETSPSYGGHVDSADSYSCSYQRYRSTPVYAPKPFSVSRTPPGDIMKNDSVTLTCSSDANPEAKYTWYKGNQKLLSEGPQLVFSSIQPSDSGRYYCTAQNELGRRTSEAVFINVNYAPKLPSLSVSPSAEIVEGSSVNLTCSSDANPAATYTWFKENVKLRPPTEGQQLVLTSIQSSDSGQYTCRARNSLGSNTSKPISIEVKYGPNLPSVSVSPSAEIVEGSSVTLTCSSDANPAANYTWYKENEDSPKASGQIFTITDFRAEHSGNYYCEAQNRRGRQNSTLHLIVVADKSTITLMTNSIRLTLVGVVGLIPLLLCCRRMRKKKALSSTTEPNEPIETVELDSCPEYDDISETAAQTEDPEEQEDLV
ncbi:uncharacterized protein LOC120559226 [Perca fluviatilis]|nr:uncharacterized protein LOC120559226 [Perca fluviatilis]